MRGVGLLVRLVISSLPTGCELREPTINCICPTLSSFDSDRTCLKRKVYKINQCLHFLDTLSCSPPNKRCINPRLISPLINQFVRPTAYIGHWADSSMLYKSTTDRYYHYSSYHINTIHYGKPYRPGVDPIHRPQIQHMNPLSHHLPQYPLHMRQPFVHSVLIVELHA